MILFLSDGRLGNQLFQYAFLNTIRGEKERIVTLNMAQFVDKFDIDNNFFYHIATNKYARFIIQNILKPFLLLLVKLKLMGYIKQNRTDTSALPTFIQQNGLFPIRLVETNFFQSEEFFDSTKIDFRLKPMYIEEAKKILIDIPNDFTKIFVHIRRGDYLFAKYLGSQGIDLPRQYFLDAMENIKQEVKNPYFIFLSDDSSFVDCCFDSIQNKYISNNNMAIDLALMSLCEYGIVSNSSFSWWGAYMMYSRKKVIFPKYWYGWKQKIESHIGIQPQWGDVLEVVV